MTSGEFKKLIEMLAGIKHMLWWIAFWLFLAVVGAGMTRILASLAIFGFGAVFSWCLLVAAAGIPEDGPDPVRCIAATAENLKLEKWRAASERKASYTKLEGPRNRFVGSDVSRKVAVAQDSQQAR